MSKKATKKPIPAESKSNIKAEKEVASQSNNIYFYTIALGLVIVIVALLRFRLLGIPLERDEGEYAYMGKLILQGIMPYSEAYNMKLPGTYFMYAFIMAIFGDTYSGIHTGLMIMTIGSIVLLFYSLKKLFNPMIALVTVACYGIMSVSVNLLGFAAHATHFVVFYVALAFFFYSKFKENKKWLFAGLTGLMFGFAFLMKQQAVFFIIMGGLVIIMDYVFEKPLKWSELIINTVVYSIGVFIPYVLVLVLMSATGNFDKFWFWTIEYASKYAASGVTLEDGKMMFGMSFKPMFDEFFIIWILAIFGLVFTWIGKYSIHQKLFATFFAVFAFASICPGFYFRQHYFIVLLPAAGFMAAITMDYFIGLITTKFNYSIFKVLPFVLVILVGINAVAKGKQYYLKVKPMILCKMIYGTNPFVESVDIAKYIKDNTLKDDKIAVLGSEPQIFVYADRRSATGHIYTYGLMEIHDYNKKMQQEMMTEIETSKPKYLVYCNVRTSWLPRPGSPMEIFDWFNKYAQANYNLVGLTDIAPQGQSPMYWDAEAQRQPQSQEYILVYKRK
jgi:hypothetical protein